ncbi:pyrroline-5-carboxylate reductase [Planctomycetota bacterium]
MKTIGFVGAGNMAEAVLQGIIQAELFAPAAVIVSDIRAERLAELHERYGVTVAKDNADLAGAADVVVLAVKPKHVPEALASLKGQLREGAVLVSIVAGKRVDDLTAVLGDMPVIRVMPNTPALINEGASGLYANAQAQKALPAVKAMFACVGQAIEVDSEAQIDAVTAVSGSGPAYYYLMIDAMIEAGVQMGLSPEVSKTLVMQTAKGAAILAGQADKQGESPADLTRKVATPGGTTEAALNGFAEGGFRELVVAALLRAKTRSEELSVS